MNKSMKHLMLGALVSGLCLGGKVLAQDNPPADGAKPKAKAEGKKDGGEVKKDATDAKKKKKKDSGCNGKNGCDGKSGKKDAAPAPADGVAK